MSKTNGGSCGINERHVAVVDLLRRSPMTTQEIGCKLGIRHNQVSNALMLLESKTKTKFVLDGKRLSLYYLDDNVYEIVGVNQ